MKKNKIGAIKLFFLFATLGAFPFLYPATQYQHQNMPFDYVRAFEVQLMNEQAAMPKNPSLSTERPDSQTLSKVLLPIDPALGSEVQPDPVD